MKDIDKNKYLLALIIRNALGVYMLSSELQIKILEEIKIGCSDKDNNTH